MAFIRAEIRETIGLTVAAMSDADLLVKINDYYTNKLPSEIPAREFDILWFTDTVAGQPIIGVPEDIDDGQTPAMEAVTDLVDVLDMNRPPPFSILKNVRVYRDPKAFYASQHYEPETNGKPRMILFYNRTIRLRPPPDGIYRLRFRGRRQPTDFVEDSDKPLDPRWGDVIAYGTAVVIAGNKGMDDELSRASKLYEYHKGLIERRNLLEMPASGVQSAPSF